jgi:hypothetical protein
MSRIYVNNVLVASFDSEEAEALALGVLSDYSSSLRYAHVVQELGEWQVQELDTKTQEFSTKAQDY